MSNGTAIAKVFVLAACMLSSGGCDTAAAPRAEGEVSMPQVRYRVDAARNRIWVLTQDGLSLYDVTAPRRIAIALPQWTLVDRAYACLPDLALGPRGDAVITSNVVPTLWRIDSESLAVTVHPLALDADTDKDVGFSGLVYSAEEGAFFAVSYAHGSLWRIDPTLVRASKIGLAEPMRGGCGIAARARGPEQSIRRFGGLCVRTPQESWQLDFSPSGRSAHVAARVRAGVRFPPFGRDAAQDEACG